jgi:4-amino-4-deoxy-L-arabinose transferase-like glycosyltransferase
MSDTGTALVWGRNLSSTATLALMALLLGICVFGLGRDLWTPDEPREAEISREMWLDPGVIPTLNDEIFIEKPPLYYWTVAGVFELTGSATPWAARSVSAASGFLTLLLVFLWGRREFSVGVGALAAIGLATSAQFMISSHWVLIDPLLMLVMTVAAWAAWELLGRNGGARAATVLHAALVVGLWTKGLIGPVLLGCGLVVMLVWTRDPRLVWRLRPLTGTVALTLATALFVALVYRQVGFSAVREWFWVNHVQRFIEPENTGHAQPFYYYLLTIPTAALPWWVPFADVFRRSRWRDAQFANRPFRVYLASLCLGMTLILSASTTKRAIYLLPMLPLLALLIAAHAGAFLERLAEGNASAWPWWAQAFLVLVFALCPPLLGMAYVGRTDALAIGLLAAVTLVACGTFLARRDKSRYGVAAICATSVAGFLSLFTVAMHLGGPAKNMTEFVRWIDTQLPHDDRVYGYGTLDETFDGIVPFVTGRRVTRLTADDIDRIAPPNIVVQDKDGGASAPDLSPRYRLLRERSFGPGRYFAIWRRRGHRTDH